MVKRTGGGYFNVLLIDVAIAFRPIGLDSRQPGLVRKEGQIVYNGNMIEKVVTCGNQEYVS